MAIKVNECLSVNPDIIYSDNLKATLRFKVTSDGPHLIKYFLNEENPLMFETSRNVFDKNVCFEKELKPAIVNIIRNKVKFNTPDEKNIPFTITAKIKKDILGAKWTFAGSCVCTYLRETVK